MESFDPSIFDPSIVDAFIALAGVIVGAMSTALASWLTQRGETKRAMLAQKAAENHQLREALFHFAERMHDFVDKEIERHNQNVDREHQIGHLTFADYFVIALAFENIIQNGKISDKSLIQNLAKEFDTAVTIVQECRKNFMTQRHTMRVINELLRNVPEERPENPAQQNR